MLFLGGARQVIRVHIYEVIPVTNRERVLFQQVFVHCVWNERGEANFRAAVRGNDTVEGSSVVLRN